MFVKMLVVNTLSMNIMKLVNFEKFVTMLEVEYERSTNYKDRHDIK